MTCAGASWDAPAHILFAMNNFFVMFIRVAALSLMIIAGVIARRKGVLDNDSTLALSKLLTNYIYPPTIFASLVSGYTFKELMSSWVYPVSELLVFAIGFTVGAIALLFFKKRSDGERRMFHYQCSLFNFMFLPLPLVMGMFGEKGVAILSLGFVGGEIGVWTIGIVAITGGFSLRELKKALCMPIFGIVLAMVMLVIIEFMPGILPEKGTMYDNVCQGILNACRTMGAGTVGISMIIAGSNMAMLKLNKIFQPFHMTLLVCRLLIIPALSIFALRFLPIPEEGRMICYLVAMMPSSIASAAYSTYFNADADTAATAILTTHVGCLLTVPFWMALLM